MKILAELRLAVDCCNNGDDYVRLSIEDSEPSAILNFKVYKYV